jgi:predicted nucleic acid-binding protein
MSRTLAIEMNDDVFPALQEDPEEVAGEMRLFAAVRWYQMGRVSQSKAAEIAGLTRSEFLSALSRCAVSPFQETAAEITRGLDLWGAMKVVCNASPFITLAKAELLEVLRSTFECVAVPEAVAREVLAGGTDDAACRALQRSPWLERVTLTPPVSRLATVPLGEGEAEVIEWALRNTGYVALLDDRAARRCAEALGVPCAGTLRLLHEAARRNLAPPFPEAVRRLREAGFYCDERIIDAVTQIADRTLDSEAP